jgi:hypothetical protein
MAHYCEAVLITCEDFRLHQRKDGRNYIAEFIKDLDVDCDLITRGGGVQDMVRPKEQGYCDCLLRDTQVSAKLHKANIIYLVNHEDCGAYGDMNFSYGEIEQHCKDLRKAKEIILENFPDKEVKLYFGELKDKPDVFEIKSIE